MNDFRSTESFKRICWGVGSLFTGRRYMHSFSCHYYPLIVIRLSVVEQFWSSVCFDVWQRGTAAPCGRYPYMTSLRDRFNIHRCGGVLIAGRWILTAAHCVDPKSPTGLQRPIVVVGACNLGDQKNENGDVEVGCRVLLWLVSVYMLTITKGMIALWVLWKLTVLNLIAQSNNEGGEDICGHPRLIKWCSWQDLCRLHRKNKLACIWGLNLYLFFEQYCGMNISMTVRYCGKKT